MPNFLEDDDDLDDGREELGPLAGWRDQLQEEAQQSQQGATPCLDCRLGEHALCLGGTGDMSNWKPCTCSCCGSLPAITRLAPALSDQTQESDPGLAPALGASLKGMEP